MMLDDSAQSKLWRTSALNLNVRLFRLPSVLAAFLATPGGSESRSTHKGPEETPGSASNEPTAAKMEQSGAMDHVKQCQFPSYSRKLGFTKKKMPN